MRARDVGNDDVKPRAVRQRGIDERRRDVHAAAGCLQHALDEIAHLRVTEREFELLRPAAARDEDTVGSVDPDLLDVRVIEVRLQGAEARERGEHLPLRAHFVGYKGQRAAKGVLRIAAHLVARVSRSAWRVRREVDAVPAHPVPHAVGDEAHGIGHAVMMQAR